MNRCVLCGKQFKELPGYLEHLLENWGYEGERDYRVQASFIVEHIFLGLSGRGLFELMFLIMAEKEPGFFHDMRQEIGKVRNKQELKELMSYLLKWAGLPPF